MGPHFMLLMPTYVLYSNVTYIYPVSYLVEIKLLFHYCFKIVVSNCCFRIFALRLVKPVFVDTSVSLRCYCEFVFQILQYCSPICGSAADCHLLLLLLLKKAGSARLRESDIHPISPKTSAPQYQPIDRKNKCFVGRWNKRRCITVPMCDQSTACNQHALAQMVRVDYH